MSKYVPVQLQRNLLRSARRLYGLCTRPLVRQLRSTIGRKFYAGRVCSVLELKSRISKATHIRAHYSPRDLCTFVRYFVFERNDCRLRRTAIRRWIKGPFDATIRQRNTNVSTAGVSDARQLLAVQRVHHGRAYVVPSYKLWKQLRFIGSKRYVQTVSVKTDVLSFKTLPPYKDNFTFSRKFCRVHEWKPTLRTHECYT